MTKDDRSNQGSVKRQLFDQLARIGKSLSSASRLELLDLLAQGPRTVESLAEQAGLGIANTSQHLKQLRTAGLVEAEKQGLFVTYSLPDDRVAEFLRAMRILAGERLAEIDRITKRYLTAPGSMEAVDRAQLARRVRDGVATVLDVRPAEEFRAAHIAGAVSIPLAELKKRLADLPRDQEIVAYCRGPYCVLAVKAVELLRKHGFRAVRLEDGVQDWKARGLPVAKSA